MNDLSQKMGFQSEDVFEVITDEQIEAEVNGGLLFTAFTGIAIFTSAVGVGGLAYEIWGKKKSKPKPKPKRQPARRRRS